MEQIYKNILDRYSFFMNKKYNFSKCQDIIIPIDKIIEESSEEIFHKKINFSEGLKGAVKDIYLKYLDEVNKRIDAYFIDNYSFEQFLYTFSASFYKLIWKYDSKCIYTMYKHVLRTNSLTLIEFYTLIMFTFEEAYLHGLKEDNFKSIFSIKIVGQHIFNFRNLMITQFLEYKSNNIHDGLAEEIITLDYLNKLSIDFFKIFWNNYYEHIFNDSNFEQIKLDLLFQLIYPTLTNEQIENIILYLHDNNINDIIYLRILKNINSSKIDLYRSYLLIDDLKN